MSGHQSFKSSPRQIRQFIIRCLAAKLVPYVQSSPGMGKSALVKSIAKEFNLEVIDHRLSTSNPVDLSGFPNITEGRATFSPFDTFPTQGTEIPKGKDGWILFLDEFNSAPKSVQAAAYKLVLDREVGQHKLHDNVVIVAAGNLASDRAIVNPLSTAMQSRVVHLEMELNHKEFMEDVAFKEGWDTRIIAFLSYQPSKLHDFRPDHNDKTFCCPRTWSFMNAMVKDQPIKQEDAPLYAGTITSGTAVEFIQFTRVFDSLPKIEDIMKDPESTPVPGDPPVKYAVTTYLIEQADKDNFDKVAAYINRFSAEFRVLFFRGLMIRKPQLRTHPAFVNATLELSRYLHD